MSETKQTVLTGLRANAEFHLGNYLGALLPMAETIKQHAGGYRINLFVPDLHSFTTPVDHSHLYAQVIENVKAYKAAGIPLDHPDIFIYRQSRIPAHSELTWILDCFTYVGEMGRMTQFKDKSVGQDNVSVGLFNYPVLMAADILLYGAKWVPVGEDQTQHIEITRDIALRMNKKFESVYPDGIFTPPEDTKQQLAFAARDTPVRIRSLVNPEKKMSKSVSDPRGTITLTDDPKDAAKKIMSATTDSFGSVGYDWQTRPGITNLLQILALLSGRPQAEVNSEWEGNTRYGELKTAVAGAVESFLNDFQAKRAAVSDEEVHRALKASETRMNIVASTTLERAQKAVGLRPRD